ncbi:BRCA2, oligonucleotide/oligosaccharide-binding, domain 1-domain-containing protein [Lentinula lateritia]|nr:BRCA2, oligonucleotide/oligosaccharide-binding, domain 1-domain-containing protein [Lentinula lateritia]
MSSPSRKRQKTILSSPVYPEMDLSQDELLALDEIERKLSQSAHSSSQTQPGSPSKPPRLPLSDPAENPFQVSSKKLPAHLFSSFKAASAMTVTQEDPDRFSPDPTEEKDYSTWFESTGSLPSGGFQTASSASTIASFTSASALGHTSLFSTASSLVDKEQLPVSGFRTARKDGGLLAPSAAALAKAQEKIRTWQEEEPRACFVSTSEDTYSRSPLRAVQNSVLESETPCPPAYGSGFASASQLSNNFTSASGFTPESSSNKPSTFVSPLIDRSKSQNVDPNRPKPFKSPLTSTPKTVMTPTKPVASTSSSARLQHPLAAPPSNTSFRTPVRPTNDKISFQSAPSSSTVSSSAQKPASSTSRHHPNHSTISSTLSSFVAGQIQTTPAKFVTPFKTGMKPGEAGRLELEAQQRSQQRYRAPAISATNTTGKLMDSLRATSVFDMTVPPTRISLSESGLFPQQYTAQEMIDYNVAIEELSQITNPSLALYYSFYTTPQPSDYPSVVEDQIGPAAALAKLLAHGCSRATKAWVDNAWSLILWKLAGMVALEPERETRIPTFGGAAEGPRWCWNEIWRQLLYRYEREINLGIRAPFHLITTQDHPATAPMVLCVSNIIWPEASSSLEGQQRNPQPLVEVTDGWYLLRAQIDVSMTNALKKGKLRVGRKIAVVGSRFETERKDPLEPLEAYQSTKLVFSANSSQLAPWHAKLGFQRGPYIFTMHSLTPEGGNIALMDIVVLQVHPVAYLEFRIDSDGKKHQEGPRNEADEAACKESWRKKREAAESKIYEMHEKKIARYLSYAERLDQKAARFAPSLSEDPPENIDSLYEELEVPEDAGQVISQTKGSEAAWLARYIRERLEKDRERVKDELEKEVDDICPSRNVRSFRVIIVQDSRTSKFPSHRTAQLTIWDVMDLKLTEEKPRGYLEIGWRCRVTNLIPSSKAAWMGNEPDSQIFLVSTRVSKWQKLRSLE